MTSLHIRLCEFGENKGKHTGKICFKEDENGDEFIFSVPPERTKEYLALVKDEVVRSAHELSEKIDESLSNFLNEERVSLKG